VMPKFDNDPLDLEQPLSDEPTGKAGNIMLYTGTVPDGVSGYGVTSAVGTGYSGYFSVVFGLDIAGNITSVKILETLETPGLGSKASQPQFIDQFEGKRLDDFKFKVTKDGGDVDAITGATITSRAVCAALEQGLEAFKEKGPGAEAQQSEDNPPEGQDTAAADGNAQSTNEAADGAADEQPDESGDSAEGQDG
jgi:electron transport complex protein RnfG